jgi:hypothetical protein
MKHICIYNIWGGTWHPNKLDWIEKCWQSAKHDSDETTISIIGVIYCRENMYQHIQMYKTNVQNRYTKHTYTKHVHMYIHNIHIQNISTKYNIVIFLMGLENAARSPLKQVQIMHALIGVKIASRWPPKSGLHTVYCLLGSTRTLLGVLVDSLWVPTKNFKKCTKSTRTPGSPQGVHRESRESSGSPPGHVGEGKVLDCHWQTDFQDEV